MATRSVYDPESMFKGMTDLQRDINSINTVGWCMTVLKANRNAITFERAFMARYLLHVVGDIHQPLHSVQMFNSTFKNGDLGGNSIKITTAKNESMNLHAFMDSMAGEQSPTDNLTRPLNDTGKKYITELAAAIAKIYTADSFGDLVKSTNPHSWALESYESAKQDIYATITNNMRLTPELTETLAEVSRKRVALAGYRLANMIATIYA